MAFNIFKKKNQPRQDAAVTEEPVEFDRPPSPSAPAPGGFYQRLRDGLAKTRQLLTMDIDQLFRPGKQLAQNILDDLEERLITADIGVETSAQIITTLAQSEIADAAHLKSRLKEILLSYVQGTRDCPAVVSTTDTKPHIILVVGVNGVGKTTTIGKLAAAYIQDGKRVMLVAADTFRAAAIEQLEIWAKRTGADFVRHRENADPSAVVFDGLAAALSRGTDVVLIDTAGRLHTKTNLMEELKKIRRTITKQMPDAPHEVLLVLDATTGQNALSQAAMFAEAAGITGVVLTKVDGTAKGGIVINLCHTFRIPLCYIGVGEQSADLQPFNPEGFIDALF